VQLDFSYNLQPVYHVPQDVGNAPQMVLVILVIKDGGSTQLTQLVFNAHLHAKHVNSIINRMLIHLTITRLIP